MSDNKGDQPRHLEGHYGVNTKVFQLWGCWFILLFNSIDFNTVRQEDTRLEVVKNPRLVVLGVKYYGEERVNISLPILTGARGWVCIPPETDVH